LKIKSGKNRGKENYPLRCYIWHVAKKKMLYIANFAVVTILFRREACNVGNK
jgi:hypothetical protein